VHKFQGREKDVIIISTVADTVTPFIDNPNLLNVAVSRAKKQLYLVVSDSEQPKNSNIGYLTDYIEYNNGTIEHSDPRHESIIRQRMPLCGKKCHTP
jgi:superfamily I DNA and/or RNA helicase